MSRPGPACRSELAREKLKDTAFIQDARMIEDVAAFVTAWTGL
ncbi:MULTISPECIES: hypothetical protein [Pseudomonas]|nr:MULTISPECIES: hypothetical protein [Pseudomonas]